MKLKASEMIEITGEHKGVTLKPTEQLVEKESDRGTLATYARTARQRSEVETGTSASRRRTP
jgi:hypothetical protein